MQWKSERSEHEYFSTLRLHVGKVRFYFGHPHENNRIWVDSFKTEEQVRMLSKLEDASHSLRLGANVRILD